MENKLTLNPGVLVSDLFLKQKDRLNNRDCPKKDKPNNQTFRSNNLPFFFWVALLHFLGIIFGDCFDLGKIDMIFMVPATSKNKDGAFVGVK